MSNPEHLAIIHQGVEQWNEWRKLNPKIVPDLTEADLRGRNLAGAHLRYAVLDAVLGWKTDLRHADLRGAHLERADLREANLAHAHLDDAHAFAADLYYADLTSVTLDRAKLGDIHLAWATLTGASFFQAILQGANLVFADLTGANLQGSNLMYANLTSANLTGANLTGSRVFGVSAWEVRADQATQSNLVITRPDDPTITVDNLEVAQFVYLLIDNKKIRQVIDTVARKAVLILGRFSEQRRAVLDAIRVELGKRDYVPIIFDFDKPDARNVAETVRTLAHLSRFIIADITDPRSIPRELETIVPLLAVPVKPLLMMGDNGFSMFDELRNMYHWVLPTLYYQNANDLVAALDEEVICSAEAKADELEKR